MKQPTEDKGTSTNDEKKEEKSVKKKGKVSESKKKKKNKEYENQNDPDDLYDAIIPPNGGWGWFVVACAFYCNIVVDGIQLTFGIFLKSISDYFKADYASVALAGSLMFGLHFLVGPVCAGFSSVFGLRPVTIVGAIISSIGIGASYFARNTWYLYISYGGLGGIGLGLVYMNTLVITSVYFTTLMPIAIAIVVCGTGVGTMIFAGLGDYILTITTWQTSFLVQAILAGSMGIAALSFKPLKPVKVKLSPYAQDMEIYEPERKPFFIKKNVRKSSSSLLPYHSSVWSTVQEQAVLNNIQMNRSTKCCQCCKKKTHEVPKLESVLLLSELKDINLKRRSTFREGETSMIQIFKSESEKLVRNDSRSGSAYTSFYTKIDLEKPRRRCSPMERTVKAMLDFHLTKSCAFVLFALSGALQTAALLVVYIYEKERAVDLGISKEMTVYLIICLGGANTFWRLFLGSLALVPKIQYRILAILCIIIGGIATMVSGLSDNIIYQFAFCVLFSMGVASFAVFRLVMLVQLIGADKVLNGTGISLLFMGIFTIAAPPFFGWIMGMFNNYHIIFISTGAVSIVAGLMLINLQKLREKELRKKKGSTYEL